ncbi:hypothetical protein HB779_17305 [Phyllobacterium sp. 628]|uniref:hypothetical protein n=1 Tax=Phyllobacterium sp. 628 TaxID=2718938 RepID=UPI001662418E|nr:hypothetical protein [Phyllobacterium sp. 628]QND53448.1 hypothetical protein HB779_17305 [Phyllobacterium sp. 628]
MKIEEGKFYYSRDGRKVGPMRRIMQRGLKFPWSGQLSDGSKATYNEDGEIYKGAISSVDIVKEWINPDSDTNFHEITKAQPAVISSPMYGSLAGILQAAHDQAATGKGHGRHADEKPFLEQPIMEIARMLGDTGGHSYQIMKKAQEANRMVKRKQHDAAVREFLGVINYAAAAILLIREI